MQEVIKQITEDILRAMNFESEVCLEKDESGLPWVNIKTNEAPFLIGQHGANLASLQYLIKLLAIKKMEAPCQFNLDVNNYLKYRTEVIKELARNTADQVLAEGRPITLQPMSPYERKVVHSLLADNYRGILTESEGYEPERRIVVKLKEV